MSQPGFSPSLKILWPDGSATHLSASRRPFGNSLSASRSALSTQVQSTRPTYSSWSFEHSETNRRPQGPSREHGTSLLSHMRSDSGPQFHGVAFQHHWIPSTPGPGLSSYHRVSCGWQPLSPNRSAPTFSFGKSDRFGLGEVMRGKRATPGPGEYIS